MRNQTYSDIYAITYEQKLLNLKPEVDHDPLVGVHDDVWAYLPAAALVLHRHAVLWELIS
jgi:hypothetical protein